MRYLNMELQDVWKILDCEIEHSRSTNVIGHRQYLLFQGQSENAATLCIDRYVERLFQRMTDASDWIETCVGKISTTSSS